MSPQELTVLYATNTEFHLLADRIHNSRMLAGPACPQCMGIAQRQMAHPLESQPSAGDASGGRAPWPRGGVNRGTLIS
jgi:hypothetical protein